MVWAPVAPAGYDTAVRAVLQPHLLNGPFGDPAVWVDVQDEGHALLLDLGELRALANRRLLRVEQGLVSHTHVDHFIGFDHLLRISLHRERALRLTGPRGFLENVGHKLGGYTWNLIGQYPLTLRLREIDGGEVRRAECSARRGDLIPRRLASRPFDGLIDRGERYSIHAELFDHGIPVLGFAIREHEQLAVDKDRLLREGLEPGPWLRTLKRVVRSNPDSDESIELPDNRGRSRRLPAAELAARLLRRGAGQSLAYVTDLDGSDENLRRAADLARGVHLLICEASFLHRDAALAQERNHLTARQAGELARAAGALRLAPFHFSPRYEGCEELLLEEAATAFGGPVTQLPRC
jgi:ribonuclease Z